MKARGVAALSFKWRGGVLVVRASPDRRGKEKRSLSSIVETVSQKAI